MRVMHVTLVVALLVPGVAGCSGPDGASADPPPSSSPAVPGDGDVEPLVPLWEEGLAVPPNLVPGRIAGVSQHFVLATGSFRQAPGMYNPTPSVQQDYVIRNAATGAVVAMDPLSGVAGTVQAVPGTDLFVAVADGRVGVLDARTASFVWTRPAKSGDEIRAMSPTRISLGRLTADGKDVCLTVGAGEVTDDRACRDAQFVEAPVVDGMRIRHSSRTVDLPGGDRVEVPVVRGTVVGPDEFVSEPAWTVGGASVTVADGVGFETSTYEVCDLGLIRIDYRHEAEASLQRDAPLWADAVLRLLDARTGEVVRTLGRVEEGTLVGFAGDIAVFEHPAGPGGLQAAAYRLPS